MKQKYIKLPDTKKNTIFLILTAATCLTLVTLPLLLAAVYYETQDYNIRSDHKRLLYSGLGALTYGCTMVTWIGMYVVDHPDSAMSFFLFWYAFSFIPEIVMLIVFLILEKCNNRIRKCIYLITHEHITSVKMITDTIGLPEEKVRDLLRIAIQTELKYNATLDDDEDEIDFQKSIWAKQRVVCENCGASLVANLGQTLTCDYCGGPLKVRRFRE